MVGGSFKRLTGNSLKSAIPLLAERFGCDLDGEPPVQLYEREELLASRWVHHRCAIQERSFDTRIPGISLVFQRFFYASNGNFMKEKLLVRRVFP